MVPSARLAKEDRSTKKRPCHAKDEQKKEEDVGRLIESVRNHRDARVFVDLNSPREKGQSVQREREWALVLVR